ncbi:MAG: hypothetical protein ACLS8R_09030, partial [Anaeromassilibacillus sp.]
NAGQPVIEVEVADETPSQSKLVVNYNSANVNLTIDGEPQKLADLLGSYRSDAEAGTELELVFKPAVDGRVIQSVTINGEEDETFTGGTEYVYNHGWRRGRSDRYPLQCHRQNGSEQRDRICKRSG